MEYAKWKGNIISANEISEQFETEREVRKASRRRELKCPDEECDALVKYCHGEIRGAYFAHLSYYYCDYHTFDSNDNPYFRAIRRKLQNHFSELGFEVAIEKKILPHHYAHLVITDKNKNVYAVELGTQKTSVYTIDELTKEYATANIPVRWLVVGEFLSIYNEKDLIFIKRFLVNKSERKDFIMLDLCGDKVYQCRWDSKKYENNGRAIKLDGYTELYYEQSDLKSLIFENGVFSLVGFNDRYEKWLINKERQFKTRVKELEESRRANEYIHAARRDYPIAYPCSSAISSYDARRAEILPLMKQREHPVADSTGVKWYCCEKCGKIDEEGEFVFMDRNNTGCCRECMIPKH